MQRAPAAGGRGRCAGRRERTTADDAAIKPLWTHKTQDHPWLPDEALVVERGKGVWV